MCAKFYTKEEQKLALEEFERLASVTAVIHKLDYLSRAALYQWCERKKASCLNNHGTMEYDSNQNYDKYKKHENIASQELKLQTLRRCFEE